MPENQYHAAAQNGTAVSSGMLREFRLCPAHYRSIVLGCDRRRDTSAFRFGRAVHKLILEGDAAYREAFLVGGPVNEKTGRSFSADSKTFARWLGDLGLERHRVLTHREAADIARMRDAAFSHRDAAGLLAEGWPELSARAAMEGVLCQLRLDWLRPDNVAVDLKTCADMARFEADARRLGYLNQLAFYRDVARAAGAGDLEMVVVALEKKTPFRVGVWRFPAETLAPYAAQNRAALISLRTCREKNRWPTGYEGTRSFPPAGIPPLWLN